MKKESKPWYKKFFSGFIQGVGWASGASLGFTLLLALFSLFFKLLGGIPFLGDLIGQVVQQVQEYLQATTSIN